MKNGCSSNWRADWARLAGKTYAQVLKTNKLAKNDLGGHSQSEPNQKGNAVPVHSSVSKNDKNVKNVVCKNVLSTTGLQTLPKVGQMYDKFHYQTNNRFALFAPSVGGQENTDDSIFESELQSSVSNTKNIQRQHKIIKVPNKPVVGRVFQACQQTCQNHSKYIGENCQKHAKMCSENDVLDDK